MKTTMTRWFAPLAVLSLISCSAIPFPLPGSQWFLRRSDPSPVLVLEPESPCEGASVVVRGSRVPPGDRIEVWQTPQGLNSFKMGLYHPNNIGDKLGETYADAQGNFVFNFTLTDPYKAKAAPVGNYALWLVYGDGRTLTPYAATWECPPPRTFKGQLFDSQGQPLAGEAEVRFRVYSRSGSLIVDKAVKATGGEYVVEGVPTPAFTEVTVTPAGWPATTRREGPWSAGFPSTPPFQETDTRPVTLNFGGPASSEDPNAPAFYLSQQPRLGKLQGRVYDTAQRLISDEHGAKVILREIGWPGHPEPAPRIVEVRDGAYAFDDLPSGVHFFLEIRTNLVYPLGGSVLRQTVLVAGKTTVINFGGPATADDPLAPDHPFPDPRDEPFSHAPSPWIPPAP